MNNINLDIDPKIKSGFIIPENYFESSDLHIEIPKYFLAMFLDIQCLGVAKYIL